MEKSTKPIAEVMQQSKSLLTGSGFKIEKDLFEDIVLSEQEIELALYEARKQKAGRLHQEKYHKSFLEERKYLKLDSFGCRAWALKSFREENKKEFKLDNFSEPVLTILSAYFGKDQLFTSLSKDFSFDKGIALLGNIGVGKTSLMRMFRKNSMQSYALVSCSDIANEYSAWDSKYDECPVNRYFSFSKGDSTMLFNPFGHERFGFCFDDLGTEDVPAKNFGRDKNVMAEIFLERYAMKELYPFNMMHITSNLSADKIEERYGPRVRNRMKEMFNIIEFDENAQSRR